MAKSWMHALLLLLLCVPLTLSSGPGTEPRHRNISISLNPGHHDPPGGDLLYVRSVGPNDTLHILFCSQGAPTLLLIHSNSTEATVKVEWDDFLSGNSSGSVNVVPEGSVVYSGSLVFSRVWEYDDVNDTADPGSDLFPPYELQDVTWSRFNLSTLSALLCGVYKDSNGTFCVQLSVFENWGRSELWPRLLHNPDSTQLAFWLDGLTPRSAHSRFLLELTAVGGAPLETVQTVRSIDDEFTPSIFTVSQWLSNSSVPDRASGSSPGFVQWKPVAYRKPSATLEVATPVRHQLPRQQDPVSAANTSKLIFGFYGNDTSTSGINISFGLSGEPLYGSTSYLSWTLLVGVGDPPLDSFSALVWSILAVGLGTPLLLLLLGGVWVCVRKLSAPTPTAYEPIN
uniref:Glycosylated lysosomal membrane protein n=1 Tax=Neogobius melanostomus TaxID=47308 RepID=A0A8C6WUN2_9GOBI